MQSCNMTSRSSPCQTLDSPARRVKAIRIRKRVSAIELSALSEHSFQISHFVDRKISLETLTQYLEGLVENVYAQDPLRIKQLILDFVLNDLPKLRQKLQERLSLLHYLCESLKYKQFSEIDHEIQKEWRRNILLMSLNTIWSTKMFNHQFTSAEQFYSQYHKQQAMVANLTHFYFQSALALLNARNVPTFTYLQDESAHNIINALPDWEDLYHLKLIPLLKKQNMRDDDEVNMEFEVETLQIDQKYIDIRGAEVQLVDTIKTIKEFSEEHTVLCKIQRLREIRATFFREIEQSRKALEEKQLYREYSPLEKDDIIGCFIYCIVKGKLYNLHVSLQALADILGPNCELLSRKGVDSYRADLQSAVQFLCESNEPTLITIPENLKSRSA